VIHTREIAEPRNMTWVHEVLEPDQLASVKPRLGRRLLSRRTLIVLWALRIYVLLMGLLIAFQIWNALHAGG
jgi:hypothetical protein